MSQILQKFAKFQKFQLENLVDFEKMLQNAYLLAKNGADTAENERIFAEILPKTSAKTSAKLSRAVRRDLDVGEVRPEELQEEIRAGVEHAQDLDVHTLLRPVQPDRVRLPVFFVTVYRHVLLFPFFRLH